MAHTRVAIDVVTVYKYDGDNLTITDRDGDSVTLYINEDSAGTLAAAIKGDLDVCEGCGRVKP